VWQSTFRNFCALGLTTIGLNKAGNCRRGKKNLGKRKKGGVRWWDCHDTLSGRQIEFIARIALVPGGGEYFFEGGCMENVLRKRNEVKLRTPAFQSIGSVLDHGGECKEERGKC